MKSALILAALVVIATGAAKAEPVPFVGCASDGQVGPMPAPETATNTPNLPAALASRLAWYQSKYEGVLAPKGWKCFGLYGSNGSMLFVSPEDHSEKPFDTKLAGPAIQIGASIGDTSGRFEAARIAARLFPKRRAFVDGVIAEGFEPASNFPVGPFPHDRIRRLSADAVAFETPARTDGMGLMSRLQPSADPIQGLAVMDDNNDAILLVVRLPPAQRDLAAAIVDQLKAHPPGS